jgi:hypothetical protein
MAGSSQGSPYPEVCSTHSVGDFHKHCLTCAESETSCACLSADSRPPRVSQPRPRIRICDARKVRQRVESHAAQLRLRGARARVLRAVLQLTCGWKRITDDAVRLHHIARLILDDDGHDYDLKTVGRALSSLAADRLIGYTPARGRSKHAVISIHPQFVSDIEILKRNAAGKVIVDAESVTFSRSPYLSLVSKKYLTTDCPQPAASERPQTRPIEVPVNPKDITAVMSGLPPVYDSLPRHLKWLLRVQVRKQLARGYLPQQVLAVLAAPLPDNVDKPYVLALYRFQKNSIGAGPRLRQVQREWDHRDLQAQRQAAADTTHRWLTNVTEASDPTLREDLLMAFQTRYPTARLVHRASMLAQAGRCALRAFPDLSLAEALRRWSDQILTGRRQTPSHDAPAANIVSDLLAAASHDSTCAACQTHRGSIRPELPDPIPVCDSCWTAYADPELLEGIPA